MFKIDVGKLLTYGILEILEPGQRLLFNLLGANLTKCSNTLKQFVDSLPTNCLSVFDHFVWLALKGLMQNSVLGFIKMSNWLTSCFFKKWRFTWVENKQKTWTPFLFDILFDPPENMKNFIFRGINRGHWEKYR